MRLLILLMSMPAISCAQRVAITEYAVPAKRCSRQSAPAPVSPARPHIHSG
jgi:hypothetical protein